MHSAKSGRAKNGRCFILQSLLVKCGSLDARTKSGKTVLMLAAEAGNPFIVQAVVDSGIDVNVVDNAGYTALMRAARLGNLWCVQVLLKAGIDASIQAKNGDTAISLAQQHNHDKTASAIEEYLRAGTTRSGIE